MSSESNDTGLQNRFQPGISTGDHLNFILITNYRILLDQFNSKNQRYVSPIKKLLIWESRPILDHYQPDQ